MYTSWAYKSIISLKHYLLGHMMLQLKKWIFCQYNSEKDILLSSVFPELLKLTVFLGIEQLCSINFSYLSVSLRKTTVIFHSWGVSSTHSYRALILLPLNLTPVMEYWDSYYIVIREVGPFIKMILYCDQGVWYYVSVKNDSNFMTWGHMIETYSIIV